MGEHLRRKDKKRRNWANKNVFRILMLKYHLNSLKNKKHKLYCHRKFIQKFHLNSSSSRLVNMCLHSTRSHWVLRKFRFSRMSFKELADVGHLNGVRRSSW